MKKLLFPLIILFLVAPLFAVTLPQVQATSDIFGYSDFNDSTVMAMTANAWVGHNFTNPYATDWYSNTAFFRADDARVYNGYFTILDSDKTIIYEQALDEVTAGAQTITINFTGIITWEAGHTYWLGLVTNGTSMSGCAHNNVRWVDTSNSYTTPVNPTDMALQASNTYAIWVVAVGDVSELTGSGSLPTIPPGYDTSDTDALINAIFGYLVPLLLLLIPAGILGWVTHWAKWPMMIGLAIGSGLTYLFLGTAYVWLVFLVIIGIVGMAYQSVRGGGGVQ